jgi:hypothetical protein
LKIKSKGFQALTEEMKEILGYLKTHLDDSIKVSSRIFPSDYKVIDTASKHIGITLYRVEYQNAEGFQQIAAQKEFKYDCKRLWTLKNEITKYKFIRWHQAATLNHHNLVELIEYMYGDDVVYPVFASLMYKWYNFGNLNSFRLDEKRNNDLSIGRNSLDHWFTLICLAEQIANGNESI